LSDGPRLPMSLLTWWKSLDAHFFVKSAM
jgi:hypothetical protein